MVPKVTQAFAGTVLLRAEFLPCVLLFMNHRLYCSTVLTPHKAAYTGFRYLSKIWRSSAIFGKLKVPYDYTTKNPYRATPR